MNLGFCDLLTIVYIEKVKCEVPIAEASLLILLLMTGCCAMPMIMIMRSLSSKKSGCCGKMDNSKPSTISTDGTKQSQSLARLII